MPPVRRERRARPRRGGGGDRPQPAHAHRLPAQPRAVRRGRTRRAAAEEGTGEHPVAARRPQGRMSWILHRVDDRLIHGQVVIAYGSRLSPSRIWVADDAAAASSWERSLLLSAAPGIEVQVVTVAAAAAAHAAEAKAPGGAFLLLRDLGSALVLVEAGAEVQVLNLGGLHYAPGKSKVNEYIFLDDADLHAARALLERGVTLEVQDVPASRAQSLRALIPELSAT